MEDNDRYVRKNKASKVMESTYTGVYLCVGMHIQVHACAHTILNEVVR